MILTLDEMEIIYDKFHDMTKRELSQIIFDRILPYLENVELIDIIEQYFTDEDWEWFYKEYVEE